MNQAIALQPHEIRVIKINRTAILELLWEILQEICHEKFRFPCNKLSHKKICIDWFFDEEQSEVMLWAHHRACKADSAAIMEHIKQLPITAINSLLSKPEGREYYHSIRDTSLVAGDSTSVPVKEDRAQVHVLESLFDNLGIRVRSLKKHEIRVIRLTQQAISELLWEHFMATADEVMDIPKEEIGDIRTIYHMYTEGKLEALTLYVMNFNEASDKVFSENQEYCKQNIHFTTESYSKKTANGQNYISVTLPKP